MELLLDDLDFLMPTVLTLSGHTIGKCKSVLRILILRIECLDTIDEYHVLMLSQHGNKLLCTIPMNLPFASDVVRHLRQNLLIEVYQMVERSFADI